MDGDASGIRILAVERHGTCGVCGSAAAAGPTVACPGCEGETHRDCLAFAGRCPTYACRGLRPSRLPARQPAPPAPPRRVPPAERRPVVEQPSLGAGDLAQGILALVTIPWERDFFVFVAIFILGLVGMRLVGEWLIG